MEHVTPPTRSIVAGSRRKGARTERRSDTVTRKRDEALAGVSQAINAEVNRDAGCDQKEDVEGGLSAERRTDRQICKAGECYQSSDSE